MKRANREDHGFHSPYKVTPPLSERGTVSIAIGLLVLFLYHTAFSALWQFAVYFTRSPSSLLDVVEAVSPVAMFIAVLLALVGLAFGILGLLQTARPKDLPLAGTVLNGLLLVGLLLEAAMRAMPSASDGFH